MPIPKPITIFNKHITNRFFILFAGWIPPLAIVEHRGRISGRKYKTPILAFPTSNGYVFALTYGRNVDWVKNLQASGYGFLKYNGDADQIHSLRHVSIEDVKEMFPVMVRLLLHILKVNDCLMVKKEGSY
jgi:deazaflavin-dependent oxidoreductase (nitroreductase family)